MKKIFLFMCLVLLALPIASAELLAEDIHLSRIRIGDYGYVNGDYMDSYVYVVNSNRDYSLRDATVSVRVMNGDVYDSSGAFDVRSNKAVSRSLYTETLGLAPGEYLVKVSLDAGDIRKVKYRYVIVE
jgi:hypothetical protein